jgi:hypothetical protein
MKYVFAADDVGDSGLRQISIGSVPADKRRVRRTHGGSTIFPSPYNPRQVIVVCSYGGGKTATPPRFGLLQPQSGSAAAWESERELTKRH